MGRSLRAMTVVAMLAGSIAAVRPAVAAPARGRKALWVARDAGPTDVSTAGMALAPDGHAVYVAQRSGSDFALVAHDAATGATLLTAQGIAPGDLGDFPEALAITPDGALVIVAADAELDVSTRDLLVLAFDAETGHRAWARRVHPGSHVEMIPSAIAVSPDGDSVIVTGSKTGSNGVDDFWDYFTSSFGAGTGAPRWSSTFGGNGNGADTAEDLAIAPDGSKVFVTGTSVGAAGIRGYLTLAYSMRDGSQLWKARYSVDAQDAYASAIGVAPGGGRVYVTGTIHATSGGDIGTVVYDASTGGVVVATSIGGPTSQSASDLAMTSDGFVVAGSDDGQIFTAMYSLGAIEQWDRGFGSTGGFDTAGAVAVGDGRVVVTGTVDNGFATCVDVESTAYATVAYELSTGSMLWAAGYQGATRHPDEATSVAVDPSIGTAFVTGTSDDGCHTSVAATLAYAA